MQMHNQNDTEVKIGRFKTKCNSIFSVAQYLNTQADESPKKRIFEFFIRLVTQEAQCLIRDTRSGTNTEYTLSLSPDNIYLAKYFGIMLFEECVSEPREWKIWGGPSLEPTFLPRVGRLARDFDLMFMEHYERIMEPWSGKGCPSYSDFIDSAELPLPIFHSVTLRRSLEELAYLSCQRRDFSCSHLHQSDFRDIGEDWTYIQNFLREK
ncbi:MAG: hypothetical protein HQM09_21535 [Candidatus Riflebacteria bacterium]|nr:hypothetical protein [Candidatus Riflebacteria bacterium]